MITSTHFEVSKDVFDWISSFINFERGQSIRSLRLDRMESLAKLAGHPERCAPSFHIAGSKGKGSVTGMIAAILESSGIKTARYSSPHVSDFRERILLGSGFFDEAAYSSAGTELKILVESLSASKEKGLFEAGQEPTFFELMTMWFFLCARLSNAQALAVETGIGGRLDATNIIQPLVSVITMIELEHTEILGKTITAIAGEKAGIIKRGIPLVLAEQKDEALAVFKDHAKQKQCPFFYFPDYAEINNVNVNSEGTSFSLSVNTGGKKELFSELFVTIPGVVQAHNAGLAVLAVKTAFPDISEKNITHGLKKFTMPARFEKISDSPVIVVDGAHTKNSIDLCLKTFTMLYGNKGILLFGCVAGKDLRSMAKLCVLFFSKIIITTPGTFKKSSPLDIYRAFIEEAAISKTGAEIIFIPDTEDAAEKAKSSAAELKLPLLCTGSFYLAAEIRKG